MLLKRDELEAIRDGRLTSVHRVWRRPTVKAGGTLNTRIGQLAIDAVTPVDLPSLPEAVQAPLAGREGQAYRIDLHLAGPDPRVALREDADLTAEDIAAIRAKLARLDGASARGPWTMDALSRIARQPGVVAKQLAAEAGVERDRFKTDIRKLKAMGLTVSLEVGYRLSPRGAAFLAASLSGNED
ncbi:MAG: hypothetical protein VX464_21340 [Pseudomonadota bacterium]|nr:hypothetical protein [Pseudomonadota bacterium]